MATISDVLTIKIGGDPTADKKWTDNRIKSTKYTLITFLPQNLLEQFRRIANFYFLIMSIIASVISKYFTQHIRILIIVYSSIKFYRHRIIFGTHTYV